MFDTLPKPLQQQVTEHLIQDNFPAAKKIYDAWLAKEKETRVEDRLLSWWLLPVLRHLYKSPFLNLN